VPRAKLSPDRIFVGTCAWSFDDWRNVFYPHALPRNRWLEFYARHFPAVEMDSTFYHLPSAETVGHWSALTSEVFRFCPKLPKALSHEKRLEDPGAEIAMMRRLSDELGPRFGCALLQLPPSFHARSHEVKVLRAFLRAWPDELSLSVEFRHESWETPASARLLEDYGVAWVWTDNLALDDEKHAGFGFLPVTALHLYVRLLGDFRTKYGPDGKETHRYGQLLWPRETALEHWAVKLRHHGGAEAIYLFANNHYEGMGIETARRLASKLGVSLPAPTIQPGQLDLFGSAGAG
jgi:uncharacterized protein YecE (DUF72 family)